MSDLFSLPEVVAASAGRLELAGGRRGIRSVSIDSRLVEPGALFIPLPGTRTDGHEFLGEAVASGASALLVRRSRWARLAPDLKPRAQARDTAVILVADPLASLQALARMHLRRYPAVVRVGITGSNGKTTTKELIAAILSRGAPTAASSGNLNSDIGLPLASFHVGDGHRYAVFEMGINYRGEMRGLADIARPDCALVTNIGTAHIGLLGSQQGIAREKKMIFRCFDGRQKAFLFEGDRFFTFLSSGVRGAVIPFGPKSTKGFTGSQDLGLDGTLIHWEGLQIRFPFFGAHNLLNALAAISVTMELGASSAAVREALESASPLFGRSQILRGEPTVIQDCYNANPDSMRELLEFVKPLAWPGRKVAVLGSMLQLGSKSPEAHRRVVAEAARAGFDAVLLFGAEMSGAFAEYSRAEAAQRMEWAEDFETLARRLRELVKPEDLVVIKGSRGMELERLVPELARA